MEPREAEQHAEALKQFMRDGKPPNAYAGVNVWISKHERVFVVYGEAYCQAFDIICQMLMGPYPEEMRRNGGEEIPAKRTRPRREKKPTDAELAELRKMAGLE